MPANIVLVTIDSLRADHCGFLGSEYNLTPTLDRLAERGVIYEQAIAPGPRTPSSMPVIFTGEHVQQRNLGVYQNYDQKSSRWMERQARIRRHLERFRPIPERLHELGYETGAITANPWTTANTHFDAGFDVFHAVQETDAISPDSLPIASKISRVLDSDVGEWVLTWPDYYDLVHECRKDLSDPYFLWVFLLDPHQPYLTPRRYREENTALEMYYANLRYNRLHGYTEGVPNHLDARLQRAYRDTIRSVDSFVDRLWTDLSDDDPALVVHSDHGEAFQEHGAYGHRPQLYRENVHVPLLIANTEYTERIAEPSPLQDLPSAILQLARSEEPFDPRSLTSPFVVSQTEERERVSLRSESWSYITADADFEDYLYDFQPRELYFLTEDSNERWNLVERREDVTALCQSVLSVHTQHQAECAAISRSVEHNVDQF